MFRVYFYPKKVKFYTDNVCASVKNSLSALHPEHYTLFTSYFTLNTAQHTLKPTDSTLHSSHFTLHTSQCTLHKSQHSSPTSHCRLHTAIPVVLVGKHQLVLQQRPPGSAGVRSPQPSAGTSQQRQGSANNGHTHFTLENMSVLEEDSLKVLGFPEMRFK